MPCAGRDGEPAVATQPSRFISLRQQLALLAFHLRLPPGAEDAAFVERACEALGISGTLGPLSDRVAVCYDALYSARPAPSPPNRSWGYEPSGGAQPAEPCAERKAARPRLELSLRRDLALEGIKLIQTGFTPRDARCPWPDGPGEARRRSPELRRTRKAPLAQPLTLLARSCAHGLTIQV